MWLHKIFCPEYATLVLKQQFTGSGRRSQIHVTVFLSVITMTA